MVQSKLASSLLALAFALVFSGGVASAAAETGTIKGVVTGADGNPAANVNVRLFRAEGGAAGGGEAAAKEGEDKVEKLAAGDKSAARAARKAARAEARAKAKGKANKHGTPAGQATTNARGEFAFPNLPAGEYVVVARQKGVGNGRAKTALTPGGAAEVSITLKAKKPKA